MIGAYVPRDTVVHRLDPRMKLLWFFSMSLVVVTWDDPIFLLLLVGYVLGFARLAGIRAGEVLKAVYPALPLLAILFIVNFFLYKVPWEPTFLGYLIPRIGRNGPYVRVYLDTLVFSFGTMLRFVTVLSSAMLLMLITEPTEVALGMVKLGLPPEVGMAVSIAVGYIPVLFNQVVGIVQAQTSRGWRVATRNPFKRLVAYIPVLIPTFFRSFAASEHLAAAMMSRGFGYDIARRTYLKELKIRRADRIAAAVFGGFIVVGMAVGLLGYARYSLSVGIIKSLAGIR